MQLIRIEAVNLASSIEDTEDLSTRRGGSLMLLEAINDIEDQIGNHLERISTGASAGLFRVIDDADTALAEIKKLLNDEPWCHATFVVDFVQSESKCFSDLENDIVAANRWRQMQSLSFSTVGLDSQSNDVCAVDEVRPASMSVSIKKKQRPVSASVVSRRKHGVKAKRRFYNRILGEHYANQKFANDFEEIADGSELDLHPGTLDGKLAVFYADGNSFGRIAARCTAPDLLLKWDDYIKAQRKVLLSALLERASATEHHYWRRQRSLRLETLLWGGDELMFAVPGWCGLELAQLFFEQTREMNFQVNAEVMTPTEDNSDESLTHACGLVFCHHQAPISRISTLARMLAEEGKKASRDTNSLNWVVLESFDHTGSGLDDYLNRRFDSQVNWIDLSIDTNALSALAQDLPALRGELPRSAIVRITRALAERRAFDPKGDTMPPIQRSLRQVEEAGGDRFRTLWTQLHPHRRGWNGDSPGDGDLGAWIKLTELWDYCPDWSQPQQLGKAS